MIPLGFGTGCFWKFMNPVSEEAILFVKETGATAIELSATTLERIEHLSCIEPKQLNSFSYVSIHAPSLEENTTYILEKLEEACKRLPIQAVTIHPDTVTDWNILKKYTIPFAVENMDVRKSFGKYPQDFHQHNYPIVFDVNHINTIDTSLALGKEFLQQFEERIIHIHFSGMKEKDGFLNHHPIFLTQQDQFFSITPQKPIIIESEFDETENIAQDARKELHYIQEKLH